MLATASDDAAHGTDIGEVTTNLGEKIISKEGILAGRTEYYNEHGINSLIVNLAVGEIHIALTQ